MNEIEGNNKRSGRLGNGNYSAAHLAKSGDPDGIGATEPRRSAHECPLRAQSLWLRALPDESGSG